MHKITLKENKKERKMTEKGKKKERKRKERNAFCLGAAKG